MENKDGEMILNMQAKIDYKNDIPNNLYAKPSRLRRRKRRSEEGKQRVNPSAVDVSDEFVLLVDKALTPLHPQMISQPPLILTLAMVSGKYCQN